MEASGQKDQDQAQVEEKSLVDPRNPEFWAAVGTGAASGVLYKVVEGMLTNATLPETANSVYTSSHDPIVTFPLLGVIAGVAGIYALQQGAEWIGKRNENPTQALKEIANPDNE